MPTKNISLSPQQAKFVRQSVKDGGFRNASEVLRAGLRLLEQQKRNDELKLQTLRKICKQGFKQIDDGDYEIIDPQDLNEFFSEAARLRRAAKSR